MLPVKENRQALFDALDALPWGQVPIAHTAADKGHGRITTRTIQVLPAPGGHSCETSLVAHLVLQVRGLAVSTVIRVVAPGRTWVPAAGC